MWWGTGSFLSFLLKCWGCVGSLTEIALSAPSVGRV